MIFDLGKFIKNNLMRGYSNGSFTKEQVNIFALNYLMKGPIEKTDFDEIQEFMNPTVEEIIE